MPHVDKFIERLSQAHYISTLDLAKVYAAASHPLLQREKKKPLAHQAGKVQAFRLHIFSNAAIYIDDPL